MIYTIIYIYICRGSWVPRLRENLDSLRIADPPRGARNPRNCRRNRGSEAWRSSRSSKLSTKSRFGGFEELQIPRTVDEIEVPRPRGAPGQ